MLKSGVVVVALLLAVIIAALSSGCGEEGTTRAADQTDVVDDAGQDVDAETCTSSRLIRVVFQVDFNEGRLNLRCEEVLPFWEDLYDLQPDETMHLVGGAAEETLTCADHPDLEYCATQADIDLTDEALNEFVPNHITMYDDGSNGDAVADDGIYSLALELPRGMRILYKYTFGAPGAGWHDTEEHLNPRMLELIDVNGDDVIVRRDIFGDVSSNTNRAFYSIDCGHLFWTCSGPGTRADAADSAYCTGEESGQASDRPGCVDHNGDGYFDFRETPVDLDNDCVVDDFPPPGPVEPLVCE